MVWVGSAVGGARERVLVRVERMREPPVWMNQSNVLGEVSGWMVSAGGEVGEEEEVVEVEELVRRRQKRAGTAFAVSVGTRVDSIA